MKPHLTVSRDKDIENLRQQYTSSGLLDSSSEIELSVSCQYSIGRSNSKYIADELLSTQLNITI